MASINRNLSSTLLSIEQKRSLKEVRQFDTAEKVIDRLGKRLAKDYPQRVEKLNMLLSRYSASCIETSKQTYDATCALILQSDAIQRIYNKTHITVRSAQSSRWSIFTYLMKELVRKNSPKDKISNFKPLRVPSSQEPSEGIKKFSTDPTFGFGGNTDTSAEARQFLMSADIFPCNTDVFESTIYFLWNNTNIENRPCAVKKHVKLAIQNYYKNLSDEQLEEYTEKIMHLGQPDSQPCGNLFTISIPKDRVDEMMDCSADWGKFIPMLPISTLESLQDGRVPDGLKEIPQIRVYTPLLNPEKGVLIHYLSPESSGPDGERKKRKIALAAIIDQMHQANSAKSSL